MARTELHESQLVLDPPSDEMLAVDEVLEKLAQEDPLAADFVKLRYFVGIAELGSFTKAAEVVNKITPADISDPQEVIARAKALSVELGTPGPAATVTVGTVTALAPDATPTVVNSGTSLAAVLARLDAYEKLIRQMSHEVNNSVGATRSLLQSSLAYGEYRPVLRRVAAYLGLELLELA